MISDDYFDSDYLSEDAVSLIEAYARIFEINRDEALEQIIFEWHSFFQKKCLTGSFERESIDGLTDRVIALERKNKILCKEVYDIKRSLNHVTSTAENSSY